MDILPKAIADIIVVYAIDMQKLESTPLPAKYTGAIAPLNFDIVFESSNLTELLLRNILEAVMDASPAQTLTTLFLYSKLAECIDFPLSVINNFERACLIWNERCHLYGFPDSLPPSWSESLPYLILEFLRNYNIDTLLVRLKHWLSHSYDITSRPTIPFFLMHPLL